MKVELVYKKNGVKRQLDSIYFNADGSINYVTTVDSETGHDPWDDQPEDFDWTIGFDKADFKKWKIQTSDGEVIYDGQKS